MRGYIKGTFYDSRLIAGAMLLAASCGSTIAADVPPSTEPVNEFQRAFFDDATLTLHLRSYLLDRDNTAGTDPAAWAAGGWIGYETDWISDVMKFGLVGYTSQPLWAPEDRDGTLLLKPGQEGYSVLGQAYAALKYEEQVMTLFRQLVNQPEVNPQDNRMTPNTFEGVSLKGELGPLDYYAGMLTEMKPRNSDEFINIANAAGVNENSDMFLGGVEFSPVEELKARASLYVVPDLLASSYSDAIWTEPFSDETKFRLSGQFMYQSSIGEDLLTGPDFDAWVFGIKGDVIYHGLTLTAGYTGNGSDGNWQAPYGSWPGYTSMIVKDYNRAGEQALLVGASYDLEELGAEGLVLTALAAFDLDVDAGLPENNEYDFTADYRLSAFDGDLAWLAPLWLRARYAYVDTDNSDNTNDRLDDFRVILNYELQLHGSSL